MKKIGISLDGGGVRGYLSACLLTEIAKECPKFLNKVSIFAGVSTGSFIAAALATGMTPQDIKDFYIKYIPKVFSDTWWHNIRGLGSTFRAKYQAEPLRSALTQIFGVKRIGDLEKEVLIPAYNFDDRKAKFFDYEDKHTTLVEVCLSSSAIPIYLPIHYYYRIANFIDGGVISSNPTGYLRAQMINGKTRNKHENIYILSIGTGLVDRNRKKVTRRDIGAFQWLGKIPDLLQVFLEASNESQDYTARQEMEDRYFRLNPKIPYIGLDDVGAIEQIDELMETAYMKEHIKLCADWITEHGS